MPVTTAKAASASAAQRVCQPTRTARPPRSSSAMRREDEEAGQAARGGVGHRARDVAELAPAGEDEHEGEEDAADEGGGGLGVGHLRDSVGRGRGRSRRCRQMCRGSVRRQSGGSATVCCRIGNDQAGTATGRPVRPVSSRASISRWTLSASRPETRGARAGADGAEEVGEDGAVALVREGHRVGAGAAGAGVGRDGLAAAVVPGDAEVAAGQGGGGAGAGELDPLGEAGEGGGGGVDDAEGAAREADGGAGEILGLHAVDRRWWWRSR